MNSKKKQNHNRKAVEGVKKSIRARPKGLIFVPKFKKRKENQYDGENYYIISK